jgi:hypothetical protein
VRCRDLRCARYPHIYGYRLKLNVQQVDTLGRHILRSTKRRALALQAGKSDRRDGCRPRQKGRRTVKPKPVPDDRAFVTPARKSLRYRTCSTAARQGRFRSALYAAACTMHAGKNRHVGIVRNRNVKQRFRARSCSLSKVGLARACVADSSSWRRIKAWPSRKILHPM